MERYYTFWRRLGAGIFDAMFVGLFSLLVMKMFTPDSWETIYGWSIVLFLASSLYSVLLTGLVGQTIGKIVAGIRVVDEADEKSVIGIKRAFYRESVPVLLQAVALAVTGWYYYAQPESSQPLEIMNFIYTYISFIWFFAELITMLFNPRRRAVHDYMASSVVIGLKGLRFDEHYDALDKARLQQVSGEGLPPKLEG
ncbi:MAG: RDD family protein [Chitinophagaceae bacterium]|nr:MAG: RDD family protein [Chitinophagaceae bacterium]